MDCSAPQVWRGLAGLFLISDEEEDRLPLPGGDHDIPPILGDRSFEEAGSFRYSTHSHDDFPDGALADKALRDEAPL
ncbi:hypothetical protein ACFVT2_20840 [Streptomyces sp. NPDC058000]|uniref:hypothetical protein n=1 Tax=Streptomyces sp. NPDC058000 TaxID=3346299 RepID=UPI0036EED92B